MRPVAGQLWRGVILEQVKRINAGASSASRCKSVFWRSESGDTRM
ncbi:MULTISPECIES: hypothetical protein [unclassified Bradyrhizobium]